MVGEQSGELDAGPIGGLFARNQGFKATWLHALA
jgi:hypothetical protein